MLRFWIVVLIIILADRLSKWQIEQSMLSGESSPVIDGFFDFVLYYNEGAAFNSLKGQQWLLISISCIAIIFLAYYLWQWYLRSPGIAWACSLILGGTIGNLWDRVKNGQVIDFLLFKFGNYHFPAFNIADTAIVVGTIMFLFIVMLLDRSVLLDE